MFTDKKLSNAVAGRAVRACDGCIRKRARWYCAADDAFLCQACDASVHSANPLARRHERVRLKIASFKTSEEDENCVPTWHRGFTKKARTPRHGKHSKPKPEGHVLLHPVPEICSDEASQEDTDEQLLYRVPIFDPFAAEMRTTAASNPTDAPTTADSKGEDTTSTGTKPGQFYNSNDFHGFVPSEMELAEFAADVQTLLGKGFDVQSFDMERLGFLESGNAAEVSLSDSGEIVKVEEEAEDCEATVMAGRADDDNHDLMMREPFELNFDYYDPPMKREDDERVGRMESVGKNMDEDCKEDSKRNKNLLRLNYEEVLSIWADKRSPWTTGERPELDLNDWPYFMKMWGTIRHPYSELGMVGGTTPAMVDLGREARVSRYREKRRTRLFSKKIRYEVRKLNAEKRPRMKGRFVKRASFAAAAPAFPMVATK